MPLIHANRITGIFPLFSVVRNFILRFDWLQILPMAVLLAYGVFFVYGTGCQIGGIAAEVFWRRQIQWSAVGLVLWLAASLFDYRKYGILSLILYPIGLMSLVLVRLVGTGRFGARRWLSIFGMSIQPSEIVKLLTIVLIAWILSRPESNINKLKWFLGTCALVLIPSGMILVQPNLSTALTLLLCCCAVIFVAGIRWRILVLVILAAAIAAPVGYHNLRPYHRKRIAVFLDPEKDPLGSGWNQIQSELAVGSGGLTGKGFMQGTQNNLGYLPQTVSNSDFIFSVIAEETGFAGSMLLLAMYACLLISIFRTAFYAPDEFGRYLCVGAGMLFALHSSVNIGMCIRMMPVTGLPLPLVSYGGTFMLSALTFLGIVQSVYARREKPEPETEKD